MNEIQLKCLRICGRVRSRLCLSLPTILLIVSRLRTKKNQTEVKNFKHVYNIHLYGSKFQYKPCSRRVRHQLRRKSILLCRYVNLIFYSFCHISFYCEKCEIKTTLGSKIRGGGRLLIFGKSSHTPAPSFGPPVY